MLYVNVALLTRRALHRQILLRSETILFIIWMVFIVEANIVCNSCVDFIRGTIERESLCKHLVHSPMLMLSAMPIGWFPNGRDQSMMLSRGQAQVNNFF